jgi:tetratricopeptide (TPR) repeat protein
MEEFHLEDDISPMVSRFEEMIKQNDAYYFERHDLEDIVDYYINTNHHQKALKAIRFATNQYPDSTFFLLRKSQLIAAEGQYDESLNLLEQLEIFESGNPEVFITKGSIYSMLARPKDAIQSYKQALRLDRKIEDVYLFIAFEFQNMNMYGQAARYLRRCLQLNPDNEAALFEMSLCFDVTAKFNSGIKFFNAFLDKNPYSKVAWYALGHLYSKLQQF